MWADQHDLSGIGAGEPSSGGVITVQPTTQEQVFNTINLAAQGILNERIAKQNVKLTEAQAKLAAEQAKAMATQQVMAAVAAGRPVTIGGGGTAPSTPWADWGSKILLIGGVALLGYAIWKYTQKNRGGAATSGSVPSAPTTQLSSSDASMAASNPFRRGRRRRR